MHIKTLVLFALFLLLLTGRIVTAQGAGSFEELLGKVKAKDPAADFQALRLAYARTSDYNPYGVESSRDALREAFKSKDYAKAVPLAEKILERNYVDVECHFFLREAYKGLDNKEKADFHNYVMRGLITSILNSGDGKSPESAFTVINVNEEYIVLAVLSATPGNQSLISKNGHSYDMMEIKNSETGEAATIYFNVDLPTGWLERQMK